MSAIDHQNETASVRTENCSEDPATAQELRLPILRRVGGVFSGSTVSGRAGWGLVDQSLSSLTNFGIGILAAASMGAQQFGTFALIFGAYTAITGVSAGLTSVPLTIRFSAAAGDRLTHASRASVGAALGLGVLAAIGFIAAAVIVGGSTASSLLAMGLVLPGLLTQDTWRYVFMARGRPVLAAANDGCWAVLQLIGLLSLILLTRVTVSSLVLVWGGAATAAAAFGVWQAGIWPAIRRGPCWLKTQWDLAARYAIETAAIRMGPFLVLAGVGAVAGVKAVGALRGAQLLVATLPNLLFTGIGFVAVPEGVRLVEAHRSGLARVVRTVSAVAVFATLAWCAVAIGGSLLFGRQLLGQTWSLARPLLVVTSIGVVCTGLALGPNLGLWILADARRSVRVRVISSLLAFAALPAAVIDGARGAALAITVTAALSAVMWWSQFLRRQRTARGRVADQRESLGITTDLRR